MKIRCSQITLILIIFTLLIPIKLKEVNADEVNPGPFFYINILIPATSPARNQWAYDLPDYLPQIGIGIDTVDITSWSQIYPRTWGYPGPYPIPVYENGGYDLITIGWSWGLDFDPTELYHSEYITPNGSNFYQYNSQVMDFILQNYTSSINPNDRLFWAQEMQQVFYEDQPSITIFYPAAIYSHDPEFFGWDGLLWASIYQSMENWTIPGETEFHYATPATFEDFHIYKYESEYDAQWLRQIYTGLLERYSSLGNLYGPRIASSWQTIDGMNYTVHLNPDAIWADGTPLNTSDVEFSYKLQINPSFGNPDYNYWIKYLRNNSISIIDEHTMNISFNKTYVFQNSNLGLDLIPKHIWDNIPYDQMEEQAMNWSRYEPEKIFGAGPYKLHSYDDENEIIHLIRNDNFDNWSGITPFFDDIYFEFFPSKDSALSALESGHLDMVESQFSTQISEVPESANYTMVEYPGVIEYALNNIHPYFGTGIACPITGAESAKHIRKAISHIIPREDIIEEYLGGMGYPGVTPYSKAAVGYDEKMTPYEYNRNLALEHMRAAGFEIDDNYFTSTPSINIGLNFKIIIEIIALVGGCLVIYNRKTKKKNCI